MVEEEGSSRSVAEVAEVEPQHQVAEAVVERPARTASSGRTCPVEEPTFQEVLPYQVRHTIRKNCSDFRQKLDPKECSWRPVPLEEGEAEHRDLGRRRRRYRRHSDHSHRRKPTVEHLLHCHEAHDGRRRRRHNYHVPRVEDGFARARRHQLDLFAMA